MNFNEIVAEVISITKRPDKATDIRRAVNATLHQCCLGTDFARDMLETSLAISSSEYSQIVSLTDLERFRKLAYVRPAGAGCLMELLDSPLAAIQEGRDRPNVAYVAGSSLVLNLRALSSSIKVGYFQYPPVLTVDAPDFWLCQVAPYMIVEGAAGRIFRNIGDEPSARQHEADFRLQYDAARQDLKYGVSYG